MYLYFDKQGKLIRQIETQPFRVGNVESNIIYAYINTTRRIAQCSIMFEFSDGSRTPELFMEITSFVVNKQFTPLSSGTDISPFIKGKVYNNNAFSYKMDNTLMVNGICKATIKIYDTARSIQAQGTVSFNIEDAIIQSEPGISIDEYNNLLLELAKKVSWGINANEIGVDMTSLGGETTFLSYLETRYPHYLLINYNDFITDYVSLYKDKLNTIRHTLNEVGDTTTAVKVAIRKNADIYNVFKIEEKEDGYIFYALDSQFVIDSIGNKNRNLNDFTIIKCDLTTNSLNEVKNQYTITTYQQVTTEYLLENYYSKKEIDDLSLYKVKVFTIPLTFNHLDGLYTPTTDRVQLISLLEPYNDYKSFKELNFNLSIRNESGVEYLVRGIKGDVVYVNAPEQIYRIRALLNNSNENENIIYELYIDTATNGEIALKEIRSLPTEKTATTDALNELKENTPTALVKEEDNLNLKAGDKILSSIPTYKINDQSIFDNDITIDFSNPVVTINTLTLDPISNDDVTNLAKDDCVVKDENNNIYQKISNTIYSYLDKTFILHVVTFTGTAYALTSTQLALNSDIPLNLSELNNDTGFITNAVNNLLNYYLKSDVYNKNEVDNKISAIKTIKFQKVDELPETGESNIIYLVSGKTKAENVYDEYIYLDTGWELIGTTQIDLTNYIQSDALLPDNEVILGANDRKVKTSGYKISNGDISSTTPFIPLNTNVKSYIDGVSTATNNAIDLINTNLTSLTNNLTETKKTIANSLTAEENTLYLYKDGTRVGTGQVTKTINGETIYGIGDINTFNLAYQIVDTTDEIPVVNYNKPSCIYLTGDTGVLSDDDLILLQGNDQSYLSKDGLIFELSQKSDATLIYATPDNKQIIITIVTKGWNYVDSTSNCIPISQKGAVNGVASLGEDGKVPLTQLPINLVVPALPEDASSKTYILKSINGTLTWVEEVSA